MRNLIATKEIHFGKCGGRVAHLSCDAINYIVRTVVWFVICRVERQTSCTARDWKALSSIPEISVIFSQWKPCLLHETDDGMTSLPWCECDLVSHDCALNGTTATWRAHSSEMNDAKSILMRIFRGWHARNDQLISSNGHRMCVGKSFLVQGCSLFHFRFVRIIHATGIPTQTHHEQKFDAHIWI